LLRSDLHQLKARVDEAGQNGHDVLKDMIAKVDEQIALAKQRLETSAPHPR
jgi:chromosome segregation ATPase